MSLDTAIYNRATTYTNLNAIIEGRCDADVSDQEPVTPYLVYQRISTREIDTSFSSAATIRESRVQFDSMASTKIQARALAAEVRAAFNRWQGTFAGQEILDSHIVDERDFTEMFDTETELRRVSQDFIIAYRE